MIRKNNRNKQLQIIMSASAPDSTYVSDLELDYILTILLGLDLTRPDNLHVGMFWYQGITSFYHFEVMHPRDFRNWSYFNPSDSITDQGPVPASIYEGLEDVLYYCHHLTATNHADRDTSLNWTHANFSLIVMLYSLVMMAMHHWQHQQQQWQLVFLDQALDHILTLLLGLMISDNDDALISDDEDDDVPSKVLVRTMTASNNSDVT